MTVRSCKTEHHEGGAMRVVPIFPELRPYLEEACELNGDKSEFIIARYRDSNTNLRTRLLKIINRAGVKPWPKLFHNLRASCETDLAKVHPIKAVCDWIGNSITVAQRHYLQTTEEDFERASGIENPTQIPTQQSSARPRSEPRANLGRKETLDTQCFT
jgi:integrase